MTSTGSTVAAIVLLYVLSGIGGYSLYFLKHGISVGRFRCKGVLKHIDIPPLVICTSDWNVMDGILRWERTSGSDVRLEQQLAAIHPKPGFMRDSHKIRIRIKCADPSEFEGSCIAPIPRSGTM